MSARLKALRKQFTDLQDGIKKFDSTAAAANRDLTEQEEADQGKLFDRAEQLKPEIEKLAGQVESMSAVGAILDRVAGTTGSISDRVASTHTATPPKLSAGEYLLAAFSMLRGDITEPEFLDRTAQYHDRALQVSGDTLGLLPQPIIGEVLKLADSRRPVFNSMSQRPMPGTGRKFDRPRISQRAQVGTQAAEGDALSSQKMTVTFDEVTKQTVGGTLEISNQDIEWTDPASLDLLVTDFGDLYVEYTESIACDFVVGLIANWSDYDDSTVATLVNSYVQGVLAAYDLSKRNPDTVWLDLASWGTLASTTTTSENKSALTVVRETLTELGTPMRFVVGPQLDADTRIVGTSTLLEAYEKQNGLLRAAKVSTLTQEIAYSGYVATHGLAQFGVMLGDEPGP